jgi:hypothetical protein
VAPESTARPETSRPRWSPDKHRWRPAVHA